MLYQITRADLVHLDSTEGVPGWRYRHLLVDTEDIDGRAIEAVTYFADGKETDGSPSLRYIILLRDGAQGHGLPKHYLRFLDDVKHAEYVSDKAPALATVLLNKYISALKCGSVTSHGRKTI